MRSVLVLFKERGTRVVCGTHPCFGKGGGREGVCSGEGGEDWDGISLNGVGGWEVQ